MNTSVRINVRVLMGNAVELFNRLRTQIRGLEDDQRRLGDTSESTGKRTTRAYDGMAQASRRLTQSGRILLYNFTLPLVGAFTLLERQALKNSEQFALLSQVYTTSAGESAKFGDTSKAVAHDLQVLDKIATVLSGTYGVAKDQVLELMVAFGRAGLAGADLAKSTKTALVLMAGFQVNTTQATDAILQLGVSYHLTADQVAVATAVITDASQKTRADVQTLVAGFVKAAPAASQLGISVSQLADYLAVLQQAGFKGAESGTAFNFMLTRLVEATPKAIKLFKNLGLEFDSAAFQAADGSHRLDMVTQALARLSGSQRAIAVADLFGIRQYPKAIALLTDLLSKTGEYAKLQEGQRDSTALVAEQQNALALAMDNSSEKFKILKTQLINNFTIIANDLTPALLALTNMVVAASRWFAHLGDTAGGRTAQALIITAGVILAMVGPIALIIGSFGQLITVLEPLGALLAAVFSPIGLAVIAVIGLVIIFRKQFVAVMVGLYNDLLIVCKAIYDALQWINPFAHHSPSLVERTRDGVAAIVQYWRGLAPIFGIMDQASKAVQALTASLAAFTAAQEKADLAKMRGAVVKVGGAKAGSAFDGVVASNNLLLAQLPKIQAAYTAQEAVVAKAKSSMDAASSSVDAASAALEKLKAAREDAAAAVDKMGNPDALQSQADAASNMARSLSEAGNGDLAQQFAAQAKHLGDQATKASAAKKQLDEMDTKIKEQQAALDALIATRDALNATYDTENQKLQDLANMYKSVQDEIDANTAALQQMAAAAQAALDAAAAAAKAAAGAGLPPAFTNAAGGNTGIGGPAALPPNLPKGAGGSLDDVLKGLNADQAKTMQNLFPNPFKMFKGWVKDAEDLIDGFLSWFDSKKPKIGKFDLPGLPGHKDIDLPKVGAGVGGAIKAGAADFLTKINWPKIQADGVRAWASIQKGFDAFSKAVAGPLADLGSTLRDVFGFLLKAASDVYDIFANHIGKVLDGFANFWATNGKQIGQILGFIAAQAIGFANTILKIAEWCAKLLWPVVKFVLGNILGVFENLWKAIEGGLQFVIQLLTGNFSKAFDGLGQMLSGLAGAIWDALKAIGGTIVLAIAGLVLLIADEFIAGLADLGPMLGRFAVKIPGWLWDGITLAWKGVMKLAEFFGSWLDEVAPGALKYMTDFAGKIPGWLWDGLTSAWDGFWTFESWLHDKFWEYIPKISKSLYDFAGKLPGWLWDGLKAAWDGFWTFESWLHDKFWEYIPKISKSLYDFAGKIPGWLWDGLKAAWNGFWTFESWLHDKFWEYAPKVSKSLMDFAGKIPGWLWDGLKAAWKAAWDFENWLTGKFDEYAPKAAKAAGDFAKKIPGWLWDGLTATVKKGLEIGKWVIGKIEDAAASVGKRAVQMGSDLLQGIIDGIKSLPGALSGAVTGVLSDAFDAGKHFLGIKSPSKLMREKIGAPITAGIAAGIADGNAIGDSMVAALKDGHEKAKAFSSAASLSLPVLQQRVSLMYEGQLKGLPTVTAAAQGGDGSSATGAGGSGNTYNNQTINVDATKSESSDPHAMAAAIAWKQRTTVSP